MSPQMDLLIGLSECCDSTILTLLPVFLSQNTQGSARAAEGGRAEPQARAKALHDLTAECCLQDACPVFGGGSGGSLSSPGREAHLGIKSILFYPISASSLPLPSPFPLPHFPPFPFSLLPLSFLSSPFLLLSFLSTPFLPLPFEGALTL